MSENKEPCLGCEASGKLFAFTTRLRRPEEPINKHGEPDLIGSAEFVRCYYCQGTGFVPAGQQGRAEKGERMRADRLQRGVSLGSEARRLGIRVSELSAMERGIAIRETLSE